MIIAFQSCAVVVKEPWCVTLMKSCRNQKCTKNPCSELNLFFFQHFYERELRFLISCSLRVWLFACSLSVDTHHEVSMLTTLWARDSQQV
jgi:hypothetical protein